MITIDVTQQVNKFLTQCKKLLGDASVTILSFSKAFKCKTNRSFHYLHVTNALEGCRAYQILEKQTDCCLWRDYLPDLSIKLLYGTFPLVQKECVTPRFGTRTQIKIENRFTLPKNCPEYQFDLIQNNLNQRKQFVAVVKRPEFPLSEDVECSLELLYQYGEENPFSLVFHPIDQSKAGFTQAKVEWKRRRDIPYPTRNLPAPKDLPVVRWNDMEHFQGRDGPIDIPQKLTSYFNRVQESYEVLDLSGYPITPKGPEGKHSFVYKGMLNNETVSIRFLETNTDKEETLPELENLHVVSFQLRDEKPVKRMELTLRKKFNGLVWAPDNKTGALCHKTWIFVNNEKVQVHLYANNFDSCFHPDIDHVTFELSKEPKRYEDGTLRYSALNIRDASLPEPQRIYWADKIRVGNRPAEYIYNGYVRFLMNQPFLSGLHLSDKECLQSLCDAFAAAKETWVSMYQRCTDPLVQNILFSIMSRIAGDLGDSYYTIAQQRIENYKNRQCKLLDHIGYALYDRSLKRERELLEQLCTIEKPGKVVCILSKAVWGHPDFVKKVPHKITLDYLERAINYIGQLCEEWQGLKQSARNRSQGIRCKYDIQCCFEYILGVFRLRRLENEKLNEKLSLKDPEIQKLYRYIEQIIEKVEMEASAPLKTLLQLEIPDKKQYAHISNLSYAMLVYTTGHEEGDAIQISGISESDMDELQESTDALL